MPLYKCILILSNIHKKISLLYCFTFVQHSHFFTRIYWKGIQINVTCLVSYCTGKEKRIIYNNVMFMKLPNYFDYTVHFRLNLITFNKRVLLCSNFFSFCRVQKSSLSYAFSEDRLSLTSLQLFV